MDESEFDGVAGEYGTDADPWRMGDDDPFAGGGGSDAGAWGDGDGGLGSPGRPADVSDRFGGGPAARRRGIENSAAAAAARREPHIQKLTQQDTVVRQFSGAQFVAYMQGDAKMLKNGGWVVSFVIPYEFKDHAFNLTDAVGMPLSIDVQVWSPFREAMESEGA